MQTPGASHTCWIHIQDVYLFLKLGANPDEQRIGQNIKLDVSLRMAFEGTEDKLDNVVDYSKVISVIQKKIESLSKVSLLEYLVEALLNEIGARFPDIYEAKIRIQKGYVPLPHFTGSVVIEASKVFIS